MNLRDPQVSPARRDGLGCNQVGRARAISSAAWAGAGSLVAEPEGVASQLSAVRGPLTWAVQESN